MMGGTGMVRAIRLTATVLSVVLCAVAQQRLYVDQGLNWTGTGTPRFTPLGSTDLLSPDNFRDGTWYTRTEILTKPSSQKVVYQLCMWQDGWSLETCSACQDFTGTGVLYDELKTPAGWWKLSGGLDWSSSFTAVGYMLKPDGCGSNLLTSTACGTHCYDGNDLFDHVPITMDVEIIAVAQGATLQVPSNWTDCPWGTATEADEPALQPRVHDTPRIVVGPEGRIQVPAGLECPATLRVVDSRGRSVRSATLTSHGLEHVDALPTGWYSAILQNASRTLVVPLVVGQ